MSFFGNLLGRKKNKDKDSKDKDAVLQDYEERVEDYEEKIILEQLNDLEETEQPVETPAVQGEEENTNGLVAISNGQVKVTNSEEEGLPARIQPGEGVKILINGEEIRGVTPVLAEDTVEICLLDRDPIRQVGVESSSDKMEGYVTVNLEKGIKCSLSDYPAANRILAQAEVTEIPPDPLTLAEAKKVLAEAGLVYGINEEILETALKEARGELVQVAWGKAPLLGKDAYIEYFFSEDGKMVPSVEEGEVVAIKHLAEPGEDGMDITGTVISAPPVKDCELKVAEGLTLENQGLKAIATGSGRPRNGKNGLYIDPIYTLKGDVSVDKGPLIFKGHLVVTGSVNEGMKIETGGDLEIKGGVLHSELLAGGKVSIGKSLIASKVSSGRFKLVYESVVEKIHELNKQTKELLDTALQIRAKTLSDPSKAVAEDKIIKILLSSRFPNFFKLLEKVSEDIEPIKKYLADDIIGNLEKLNFYLTNPPERVSELPKLYQDANNTIKSLGNYFADANADILVYYVQNSELESSGGIYVSGLGCYNSDLMSKGEIKIDGHPGIFRGGKIIAGDKVIVKELGCPSSAPTYIEVPADKKIEAEFVHPGVILKVGDKIHRNDAPSKAFDIYLDKEGNLQVTKLKGE